MVLVVVVDCADVCAVQRGGACDGGACDGETTSIDAIFEQPVTSTLDAYGIDTQCWLW